ncbi:MAG: MBL fold metallo-hydrolase, partial [Pseudobdellovibrionaceae bacterium]
MTELTLTIMGCGNSYGVPKPGNDWGKCDPNDPKNRRTRCSLLVQSSTTTLVIDTGQDFRAQMNTYDISHIDALLYTHQHADHIAGADDVRVYADRQK